MTRQKRIQTQKVMDKHLEDLKQCLIDYSQVEKAYNSVKVNLYLQGINPYSLQFVETVCACPEIGKMSSLEKEMDRLNHLIDKLEKSLSPR